MALCCTTLDSEAILVDARDREEGALHQLSVVVGERLLRRFERVYQVRLRVSALQRGASPRGPLPRLRDVEEGLLNLAQMPLTHGWYVRP